MIVSSENWILIGREGFVEQKACNHTVKRGPISKLIAKGDKLPSYWTKDTTQFTEKVDGPEDIHFYIDFNCCPTNQSVEPHVQPDNDAAGPGGSCPDKEPEQK